MSTRRGPKRTALLHRTDDVPSGPGEGQLVHALGSLAGQRVSVCGSLVLGRDADCDVVLDDAGISRRHTRVSGNATIGFFVEDLRSRNGTFVNGVEVDRSPLAFGDQISIGAKTVLLFTRSTPLDEQVLQAQRIQMLGELAGGIVHDFNNILGAFTLGLAVLRRLCDRDEEALACLDDLDHTATRGSELSKQLLEFARSETIEHELLDLSLVVADAARLLRRMVPETVTLSTKIEPGVGTYGSSSQLLQVIVNLGVNGADAMPDGGELVLRVLRSGGHAVLEVIDTGQGMSEPTLERARVPFFTTKPPGRGTGLGLATVDRVAREHNGSFALTSAPGKGTTATVKLPLTSTQAEAIKSAPPPTLLPADWT